MRQPPASTRATSHTSHQPPEGPIRCPAASAPWQAVPIPWQVLPISWPAGQDAARIFGRPGGAEGLIFWIFGSGKRGLKINPENGLIFCPPEGGGGPPIPPHRVQKRGQKINPENGLIFRPENVSILRGRLTFWTTKAQGWDFAAPPGPKIRAKNESIFRIHFLPGIRAPENAQNTRTVIWSAF